jgi:Outer membrane protein beta-barrel family/CarboxypepD_reg-like domain
MNRYNPFCRLVMLIVVLLSLTFSASGQFTLSGTILEGRQPLSFVTITLKQDSLIRASTLSDKEGRFSLSVPAPGQYLLIASIVNYNTVQQTLNLRRDSSLQLSLERSARQLNGVTVIAKTPLIERKSDRIVLNVAQSISTSGSTYWEVLSRSPGVMASNSGNISVIGKAALVLIDGRITGVSGEDLAELLRSKAADGIEKIEIYTNPPARFDAQGGAVINIITKKKTTVGRDLGFRSGYRQGYLARFSTGTSFNVSTPKLRLSGNYGFAPAQVRATEDEYVRYGSGSNTSNWAMGHVRRVKLESHDFGLGGEYQVNKRQILGLKIDGFSRYNRADRRIFTDVRNASDRLDSTLVTQNINSVKRNQWSGNFNYRITTDTSGGLLELDINHSEYRAATDQTILTRGFDQAAQPKPIFFDVRSDALQQIKVSSAQLRYAHTFNKTDLEMGMKITRSTTDNDLNFLRNTLSGYVNDPQRSNVFEYTEHIQAAYFSMSHRFAKTQVQGGLRGEFTKTRGISRTLQQVNTNNYFRLFPSLFIQHTLVPDKHQLGLQYSRRINRPDYWRLNPFQFYTTPYAYLQGNPFLQPSFQHNAELSYTYKNAYTLALFINYTDAPFTNITVQDNANQLLLNNQVNLKNNKEYGAYINISKSIRPWWESTWFVQASYREENTVLDNRLINLQMWTAYFNTVQSFVLSRKKGWRAEITAWYSAPTVQGIYTLKSSNDISFTVRKSLWKNKATLAMGVQDLLFGNFYRITINTPGQFNGFSGRNDTRLLTFNFTYRLSSKLKVSRIKDRKTGAEEEKQRLGNL